ncbi:hypothetical protein HDU84_008848 [Entophlyctis sp. JEL0112]|nr:hypothetical protein HDU84_008848 [Entophlyctis sp. JEL0112]
MSFAHIVVCFLQQSSRFSHGRELRLARDSSPTHARAITHTHSRRCQVLSDWLRPTAACDWLRAMYNPHSNRGRRPTARPAPSARAAQLREAQRLHRERKRVYIEDLERRARAADDALARVAMLERQLLQPGKDQVADNNDGGDASRTVEHYLAGINSDGIPVHSPNHSSQLRQEDNQKEHQQMYPKDEHLRAHQLQHQQSRRRQWRFHPAYAFVPAARAFAAPSTASLEIRFAKLSLLAIPSLAESPNIVSRFCAVLRELVDSADRRHLRATLSDTVAAAFAIIDRCSVLEKTAALDVFASLIKANQEIYV